MCKLHQACLYLATMLVIPVEFRRWTYGLQEEISLGSRGFLFYLSQLMISRSSMDPHHHFLEGRRWGNNSSEAPSNLFFLRHLMSFSVKTEEFFWKICVRPPPNGSAFIQQRWSGFEEIIEEYYVRNKRVGYLKINFYIRIYYSSCMSWYHFLLQQGKILR